MFLILGVSNGYSQNLILNYSFENINQCPDMVNFGSVDSCIASWEDPTDGTSDCYNTCVAALPFSTIPSHNNGYGYQFPRTGNGYAGIFVYQGASMYREYIHSKLLDSLKQDSCYYMEFYVNKMNMARYAVNLGCYLSNITINNSSGPFFLLNYTPQIEQPNSSMLTDTLNWVRINGVYKANGGEQFITIGNFNNNTTIDTLTVGDTGNNGAYYYVEDVILKLIPNNINVADAGNNQNIIQGDSVQIGNNSLSDAVYSWYPSAGLNDTTLENPIAKPTVTTTYYCIKDACNSQTIDSVTVTVQPNGVENYYNNKNFKIYPNPNNGIFNISHNLNEENYVLEITDITGKVVYHQYFNNMRNTETIIINSLETGFYFVGISDNQKRLLYLTKMSVIN
ncbi:MAG: T9SS type A sorting domain-containing protein [Flavobacteriales bacterium]|nr:T9SS type A sorting domain-containing protein [Flavobacteriales bacterium]